MVYWYILLHCTCEIKLVSRMGTNTCYRSKSSNLPVRNAVIMMTSSVGKIFRVNGPLCRKFPAQRPVTRSFDFFLWSAPEKATKREAGDMNRHCAYYDAIVLLLHHAICHILVSYMSAYQCTPLYVTRLILVLHPANGRRRFKITPSLIGWAQTSKELHRRIRLLVYYTISLSSLCKLFRKHYMYEYMPAWYILSSRCLS